MSAPEPVPIPELVDNVRSAILMLDRQHRRLDTVRREDPPRTIDQAQLEDLGIVLAELTTHTAGLVGKYGAIAEKHGEIPEDLRLAAIGLHQAGLLLQELYPADG